MTGSRDMLKLNRRAVVARLLADRKDALVVTGLGSPTYDVAAAGDDPKNLYLWGAMGGAAAMGLGLALAQASRPVIVVTGDGEMLMGVGSFATIAMQAPKNLTLVILDNSLYGETGGQASHTAVADLAAMAAAAGIQDARRITDMAGVERLAMRAHGVGEGPCAAVVVVEAREEARVLPLRDGAAIRARVRGALGLTLE